MSIAIGNDHHDLGTIKRQFSTIIGNNNAMTAYPVEIIVGQIYCQVDSIKLWQRRCPGPGAWNKTSRVDKLCEDDKMKGIEPDFSAVVLAPLVPACIPANDNRVSDVAPPRHDVQRGLGPSRAPDATPRAIKRYQPYPVQQPQVEHQQNNHVKQQRLGYPGQHQQPSKARQRHQQASNSAIRIQNPTQSQPASVHKKSAPANRGTNPQAAAVNRRRPPINSNIHLPVTIESDQADGKRKKTCSGQAKRGTRSEASRLRRWAKHEQFLRDKYSPKEAEAAQDETSSMDQGDTWKSDQAASVERKQVEASSGEAAHLYRKPAQPEASSIPGPAFDPAIKEETMDIGFKKEESREFGIAKKEKKKGPADLGFDWSQ
ncbi:hypothetical protein C8J56DRAFT_1172303 [Mycena floridula]|nr:hypothetical protein C8J56DRAFT_1172303 [Mycena floridula]